MQGEAYICTEKDLPDIIRLVKQHRYIYGVDTEATGIQSRKINLINYTLSKNHDDLYIIGVRGEQGQLLSFCLMGFWTTIPAWCPLFLYEDSDQLFSKRIQQNINFSVAMQKCIEIAEGKRIYTGFFATRFSPTWKRTQDAIKEKFPEYIVSEVEILGPGEKTKYLGFERLLGGMNGLQEKTIVILQFSKSAIFYT